MQLSVWLCADCMAVNIINDRCCKYTSYKCSSLVDLNSQAGGGGVGSNPPGYGPATDSIMEKLGLITSRCL